MHKIENMIQNICKKIVLGTAQFGKFPYGISNKKKIHNKEINNILNYAWDNGVEIYDTAETYGCYDILGKFIRKKRIENKIKIITKVPKIYNKLSSEKILVKTIKKTFKTLKITNIYCLLLHDQKDLNFLISNRKKLLKLFRKYKVLNFGVSVYDERYAKLLIKKFNKAFIQFPYNPTNKSFINLKKRDNVFFARSIFLQGLLSEKKINLKNSKLKKCYENYNNFLKVNNLDGVEFSINFALANKKIDYLVIGVNSLKQLKKIIFVKRQKMKFNKFLSKARLIENIFSSSIVDPRYW